MPNYNVVIYRPCYFKVSDINANTPKEAVEKAEEYAYSKGLDSACEYVEVDEDFEPTRITVTDADAEEYTEVLVKDTPDVQTLKNLLSVPQTESEYNTMFTIRNKLLDDNLTRYQPLIDLVSSLMHSYLWR